MSGLLVVSATRIYREGLRDSLAALDEFNPIFTARTRQDVWRCLRANNIEVVLVDIASDEVVLMLKMISASHPDVLALVLGLEVEREEVMEYASAGIAGYLLKDGSLEDLVEAIRLVRRGELLCSPSVAGSLLNEVCRLSAKPAVRHRTDELTLRELELARLINEGLSNKEIAAELNISIATTKSHVHHILEKLGVSRRADIRRWVSGR